MVEIMIIKANQDTRTPYLKVALPTMPKHTNNMKIGGLSFSPTYLTVVVQGLHGHAAVAPTTTCPLSQCLMSLWHAHGQ